MLENQVLVRDRHSNRYVYDYHQSNLDKVFSWSLFSDILCNKIW
jgi:hypothetical protein